MSLDLNELDKNTRQELRMDMRDLIKSSLDACGLKTDDSFVKNISDYAEAGNLSSEQIINQIKKISIINEKKQLTDIETYTYACFSRLINPNKERPAKVAPTSQTHTQINKPLPSLFKSLLKKS